MGPVSKTKLGVAVLAAVLAWGSSAWAFVGGSAFEAADGDLQPVGLDKDWSDAPGLQVSSDARTGSTDDAFGQGTKEDDEWPSVVHGSIPPNKSDLGRFYFASESVSGRVLIYFAWVRYNILGTANMDIEFNQAAVSATVGNGITPRRTAGDILITFDFVQGGSRPQLGLLTWLTSLGAGDTCFSASSAPCWGNFVNLSAAGFAEGQVNFADVADPISGGSLPAFTFGEAAVDLTTAGVIPASSCNPFTSAYVKSRSSASFTAAVKDFIPPMGITSSTCGTVSIHKQDDQATPAPLSGAGFTLYVQGSTTAQGTCTTDAAGDCSISSVPYGSYDLKETTVPTGYQKVADQTVSISSSSTSVSLTLTDKRLFRILTFVCREKDSTLVSDEVELFDAANLSGTGVKRNSAAAADLPAGVSESALCGMSGGASYGGKTALKRSGTVDVK